MQDKRSVDCVPKKPALDPSSRFDRTLTCDRHRVTALAQRRAGQKYCFTFPIKQKCTEYVCVDTVDDDGDDNGDYCDDDVTLLRLVTLITTESLDATIFRKSQVLLRNRKAIASKTSTQETITTAYE